MQNKKSTHLENESTKNAVFRRWKKQRIEDIKKTAQYFNDYNELVNQGKHIKACVACLCNFTVKVNWKVKKKLEK